MENQGARVFKMFRLTELQLFVNPRVEAEGVACEHGLLRRALSITAKGILDRSSGGSGRTLEVKFCHTR